MTTKTPTTEALTSSRRGFLRNTTLAPVAGSGAVMGVGGRAEAAKATATDAHALLLEYARISLQSEGSPGSISVDEFIAANYPRDLKEEDHRLLEGALYLQMVSLLARMCDPYSTEEMLELETRSLPTARLGSAYFTSILAETKEQARKDPEFLREVLAAADKAQELDGVAARNKVWWPIVKVMEAVNRRDKR